MFREETYYGAVLGINKILSPFFKVSSNYDSAAFVESKNISKSLFFPRLGDSENILIASQSSKLLYLNHERAFTQIICSKHLPFYYAEFLMELKTPYCRIGSNPFRYNWKKGVSCHISQTLYISGSGG